MFKIFLTFFSLLAFQNCLGNDLDSMTQVINALGQKIDKNKDNSKVLFQIDKSLKAYSYSLKNCIDNESNEIERFSKQADSLQRFSGIKFGIDEKNHFLKLLQEHQDTQIFCQYLSFKIDYYQDKIRDYKQINLKGNYFLKENNYLYLLKTKLSWEIKSSADYFIKNYLQSSNLKLSLKWIIIIFFTLWFLKYLPLLKTPKLDYLKKISLSNYLISVCLWYALAPVQFLVLKTVFSHQNLFLLNFLNREILQVLIFTVIFYFYQFCQNHVKKKDMLLICLQILLFFLANYLCFEFNYLELNNYPEIDLLNIKYMILFSLQPLLFLVIYWSFSKLLGFSIIRHMLILLLILVACIIFIFGLSGYLNFAINTDLTIIIITLFILWIFIFNRMKNTCLMALAQPNKTLNFYLEYFFKNFKKSAVSNMKLIVVYFFVGAITYSLIAIISLSFWFTPELLSKKIFSLFFVKQEIGFFNFQLIQILQSILIILCLNLINYAVSSLIVHHLVFEKSSQNKTFKVFHWVGYFLIVMIIMHFLGFELKNFIVLFGGLSIGLGLGLKDIFSSFISSIFLFINPPYRVGDYIEIANTKGYVKQITLLETIVETFDNNTLIYPNRIVSSSVIQNYNYANKSFHKVHLCFVLFCFDISDEEKIKKKILSIIKQDEHVLSEELYQPSLIFSLVPKTKDAYRLEITICLKNLEKFQEKITRINRMIYDELLSMKINVEFEDMKYPFT